MRCACGRCVRDSLRALEPDERAGCHAPRSHRRQAAPAREGTRRSLSHRHRRRGLTVARTRCSRSSRTIPQRRRRRSRASAMTTPPPYSSSSLHTSAGGSGSRPSGSQSLALDPAAIAAAVEAGELDAEALALLNEDPVLAEKKSKKYEIKLKDLRKKYHVRLPDPAPSSPPQLPPNGVLTSSGCPWLPSLPVSVRARALVAVSRSCACAVRWPRRRCAVWWKAWRRCSGRCTSCTSGRRAGTRCTDATPWSAEDRRRLRDGGTAVRPSNGAETERRRSATKCPSHTPPRNRARTEVTALHTLTCTALLLCAARLWHPLTCAALCHWLLFAV